MQRHNKLNGFTLIELLIVVAIIALLISILAPALQSARDQAKQAVCLMNVRSLSSCWVMYAEEYGGKLVYGMDGTHGPDSNQPWNPTADFDWIFAPLKADGTQYPCDLVADLATIDDRKRGIEAGNLFRYTQNVDQYHCPAGEAEAVAINYRNWCSYNIPASMNGEWIGYWENAWGVPMNKKIGSIQNPSERFNFLEARMDGSYVYGAWGMWPNPSPTYPDRAYMWWDPIFVRHRNSNSFGFADGHAKAHRWINESTFRINEMPWPDCRAQYVDPTETEDLMWVRTAFDPRL